MSQPPLHVAVYLPSLHAGGVERMRINLSRVFLARGIRVTFVLHRLTGELVDQVPEGVRVVSLDAHRTLGAVPRLVRFLRAERPDVLLSSLGHNNIGALWARRLARVETAVVVCQHNALTSESVELGNWQHRVLPGLYRLFLRDADAVVAVSRGVADDMARVGGIARQRITVIYNPVLSPSLPEQAAQPAEHPWMHDPETPVFVALGRLVPQKDFSTLLQAFARLAARRRARLLVFGEGPLRAELAALAQSLKVADRVELAGFRANPYPFVRRAAALVMSSRYEGFGNVLVEALACGTPVVSTNCPYGPSEILEDGRYGDLVPVGDPVALARAMERVLDARPPPGRLRERAAAFDVEQVADRYLACFEAARQARSPRTARVPAGAAARAPSAEATAGAASVRKVAIYIPTLLGGGAQVVMLRLAQGLTQRGLDVTLISHTAETIPPAYASNARLLALGARRSLTALPGLVAHLRRERPDILISAFPHNNVLAVAARMLSRVPVSVVLTEHTPISLQVKAMPGLRYRALPWMLPLVYRRAAAVVAVANGVRDDLEALLRPDLPRIEVIHNPVLPSNWRELADEPVEHPWLAADAGPVVLSVARLSREKNLPALLRAFARARVTVPAAHLLLLGDGPERAEVESWIERLHLRGAAEVVGWVANPFAYMRRARALVLTSDFEGFGNVLVEGMACGARIIATDCPYGPAEILQGGAHGDSVPVGDEAALAAAIAASLTGVHRRAASVARALEFTVERSAAHYLALFEEIRGSAPSLPG